jgi:hypothetical protein
MAWLLYSLIVVGVLMILIGVLTRFLPPEKTP